VTGDDAWLTRHLVFGNASAGLVQRSGPLTLRERLTANFENGMTNGMAWTRTTAMAGASISSPGPDLVLLGRYGATSGNSLSGERFIIGGDVSPHVDIRTAANIIASPVLRNTLTDVPDFVQARAELVELLPVTLYGEWTWPGGNQHRYFATGGLYVRTDAPRVPQLGSPAYSQTIGVGTVLAGPHARRAVVYMMIRVVP
jgi:hypothetical protein